MLIMQLDHCTLTFPRSGLFSGVSLDALALETAAHTMIDVVAVSSLHMSCRLLTRASYQPWNLYRLLTGAEVSAQTGIGDRWGLFAWFAFVVSIIEYMMAFIFAPFMVSANSQFARPTE